MKRFVIGCTLLLAATVATAGASTSFHADLNGQNNVPPISAVTATGFGDFVLNDAQTQLTFHIEYTGLSSPELDSHIHVGTTRENGPIAFELPLGTPKDGVWNITPEYVTDLLAGHLYVNIHSDLYVTGEIRGNIMQVAVPVVPTTWSKIKALYP